MYDSLVAKITAGMLAAFVSLAMLAGLDALAVPDQADAGMAQGSTQDMVAASAPAARSS